MVEVMRSEGAGGRVKECEKEVCCVERKRKRREEQRMSVDGQREKRYFTNEWWGANG